VSEFTKKKEGRKVTFIEKENKNAFIITLSSIFPLSIQRCRKRDFLFLKRERRKKASCVFFCNVKYIFIGHSIHSNTYMIMHFGIRGLCFNAIPNPLETIQ